MEQFETKIQNNFQSLQGVLNLMRRLELCKHMCKNMYKHM